jgi:hypothetical protein
MSKGSTAQELFIICPEQVKEQVKSEVEAKFQAEK